MDIEHFLSLYRYNEWANGRYYEILVNLSPEQLEARVESSFPSLLATFAHIVSAEWVWLRRWLGESPSTFPDWLAEPRLADLRERLDAVESERLRFLEGLDAPRLSSSVSYRTLSGDSHSDRLADLLFHVVNHSSYHRGQLATLLRQVGGQPVGTDFVLFRWQEPA